MSTPESFIFSKGLNLKRSPLFLEDGELVSAEGIDYLNEGEIACRHPVEKVNTTAYGVINGMHRYGNNVYLTDAGSVRHKWDLNGYCNLYTPANGDFTLLGNTGNSVRPRFADYAEFTFIVNGLQNKALCGPNMYEWGIANPTDAPVGTSSTGGEVVPGDYTLYYTYLIRFPSGRTYETGPSPGYSVNITGTTILWTGVKTCPYSVPGGSIARKLYRTSAALIETYYTDIIDDNTSTSFSIDYWSNTTLLTRDILATEDYLPPPSNIIDVTDYLQRIFAIKDDTLYYSEPYIPFAFPAANGIAVARAGETCQGLIVWGDQLFIATTYGWFRLQGNDSSTWQIKNTFAEVGIINRHTLHKTRYGLIGLWFDGIYLFDGQVSKNITKMKLDQGFFDSISSLSSCYAEWDGIRYSFCYPTSGTTISKRLIIDFTNYPDVRIVNDNFVPTAYEYHTPSGIKYYGGSDGYQYLEGTTETIALSLQTGDRAMKNIMKQKQSEYLYYDINTAGVDVTLTIYADGAAQTPTYTLNHATRARKRISVGNFSGYRFSIGLSCANGKDVIIYEPWSMTFNEFGV